MYWINIARYPAFTTDVLRTPGRRNLGVLLPNSLDIGLSLRLDRVRQGEGYPFRITFSLTGDELDRARQLLTPELNGLLRQIQAHGWEVTADDQALFLIWPRWLPPSAPRPEEALHRIVAAIERARVGVRCASRWQAVRARLHELSGHYGFQLCDTPLAAWRTPETRSGASSLTGWSVSVAVARERDWGSWTGKADFRLHARVRFPEPIAVSFALAPSATVGWFSRLFSSKRRKTTDADFDRAYHLDLAKDLQVEPLLAESTRKRLVALAQTPSVQVGVTPEELHLRCDQEHVGDVAVMLAECVAIANAMFLGAPQSPAGPDATRRTGIAPDA